MKMSEQGEASPLPVVEMPLSFHVKCKAFSLVSLPVVGGLANLLLVFVVFEEKFTFFVPFGQQHFRLLMMKTFSKQIALRSINQCYGLLPSFE